MDEILWCDHSNETSSAVLSHDTICFLRCSNFLVYGWNPMMWPFKWNLSSCFFICYFVLFVVLTFQSVDEILRCDHSNKTFSTVLSHGAICFVSSSNVWVRGWNPMVTIQMKPLHRYFHMIIFVLYSGTQPYGHLGNTVTLLLRPLFFRPGKTVIHYFKKKPR